MNEILEDCKYYAHKYRGNNRKSGPYWSTMARFVPLYDEAVRLQGLVDAYENDLVLLDVSEKLSAAENELQNLKQVKMTNRISELPQEKNGIKSVELRTNEPGTLWSFKVGRKGITKIIAYYESGQMAAVPWIAVYAGDIIKYRFDAVNCVIEYKETE